METIRLCQLVTERALAVLFINIDTEKCTLCLLELPELTFHMASI